MTAGGADSGCGGERKAALGSGPVSVEGRRRRAASRAHEGPAGRRRETPRRQAHVRARVVSGKTRRSKLPFRSAEDAAGRRTKTRGDGRLLALPRTELRSLPHVCTKENDGTERTRVFSTLA